MATDAYRAPLRSRRDDIDATQTLRRALSLGMCGFGGVLRPAPDDLEAALRLAAAQYDERTRARIERFAAVADGALVWTRAADGLFWLGRIEGPWSYDGTAAAVAVDLVHVRRCDWAQRPFLERDTPAAVVATFRRGGKNFQRIRAESAGPGSERCWQRR